MKNRIRFYLDEHVPKAIAKGLKRRGVDAITVVDAVLLGATDEKHWREQHLKIVSFLPRMTIFYVCMQPAMNMPESFMPTKAKQLEH